MKIESIIRRSPPTKLTFGSTVYQFKPDEQGRHVCDVADQAHMAQLLSIPEGYRLVLDGEQAALAAPKLAAAQIPTVAPTVQLVEQADDKPKGSTVHPEVVDLGNGRVVPLDDVVQAAISDSGMTVEEWNALGDDDRYAQIDAMLDAMAESSIEPSQEGSEQPSEEQVAEREALAEQYEQKFGKRPHGKWIAEKIRAALEAPEAE